MSVPKKHDVVQVGRSKEYLLVTESKSISSRDDLRGDVYTGWTFKTIPIYATEGTTKQAREKTWTLEGPGYHMGGLHPVHPDDIRIIGHAQVETETAINYSFTPNQ